MNLVHPPAHFSNASSGKVVLTRDSMMKWAVALHQVHAPDDALQALMQWCVDGIAPSLVRVESLDALGNPSTVGSHVDPDLDEELTAKVEPATEKLWRATIRGPFRQPLNGNGNPMTLIGAAVRDLKTDGVLGVVTLIVPDNDGRSRAAVAKLDALTALASIACESRTSPADEAQAIASLGDCKSKSQFAHLTVNSICNAARAEQVSMGVLRGDKIEIAAISGTPRFKKSSPGVMIQQQAMEECVDFGQPILCQREGANGKFLIHDQWSSDTGGSSILTIPLQSGDRILGAISIRRSGQTPFSAINVKLMCRSIPPFGAAYELVSRADQSFRQRVLSGFGKMIRKNLSIVRLLVWSALIALGCWIAFGELPFRPTCEAVMAASDVRHASTPFSGRLESIHCQPGERVEPNQLLARFDTRELELELERLHAEFAENEINVREAVQAGDESVAALARAKSAVLAARVESLEAQVERASIHSPVAGIVQMGDLQRRVGDVFSQGDPILKVINEEGWTVELRIPESSASYMKLGAEGKFASATSPAEKLEFVIESVDGVAEVVDDKNVVIARAPLAESRPWMRTGMKGFARVESGNRPVWWIMSWRIVSWARLRFWV